MRGRPRTVIHPVAPYTRGVVPHMRGVPVKSEGNNPYLVTETPTVWPAAGRNPYLVALPFDIGLVRSRAGFPSLPELSEGVLEAVNF